jgi:hypothetical protein
MNVIDNFLDKYSYRFPKGYPDLTDPADKKLMQELLSEIGMNEQEEEPIAEEKKITKKVEKENFFKDLSLKTKELYSSQLGGISNIFDFPYTVIKDWRNFKGKKESNVGKSIEQVLVNYANSKVEDTAKRLSENGNDIVIDGKKIEVKSSEKDTINTILQSSFYADEPNKFYAFVLNTALNDIDVIIINSQLLHNYYLGEELIDTYKLEDDNNILSQKIKDGIDGLQFDKMILSSLVNGKVNNEPKSFKIGKIRVRFILNISTD